MRADEGTPHTTAAARRARLLALLLSGLLASALSAAVLVQNLSPPTADAHHGQPATGESEPGESLGDTEQTPVAKDGSEAGWEQIAGARWASDVDENPDLLRTRTADDSPTPYDLDFYGVDFHDKTNGFAVGAQCRREDPAEPVPADEVSGCDRVPVIYRYRDDFERGLVWEESYRGSDQDDPGGFIAAAAWLGPDRALAVGGTGTYPRRESERKSGESDDQYARRDAECLDVSEGSKPGQCEGAGMARVWLFEGGSWRELRNEPDPPEGFTGEGGDEIPDAMRALQAIDASPRPTDCGADFTQNCAVAGGMRQLWHFSDGRFTDGFGPELAAGAGMTNAAAFRYRVRDLRFAPPPGVPAGQARAMAVTAGCCAQTQAEEVPALLSLVDGSWRVTTHAQNVADGYYALRVYRGGRLSNGAAASDFPARPPEVTNPTAQCGNPCNWPPNDGSPVRGTGVRAPGGPSPHYRNAAGVGAEPGSCATAKSFGACAGPGNDTLRLLAGDGDLHQGCSGGPQFGGVRPGTCPGTSDIPDGKVDWAVGVLRGSGRGAAFFTALRDESTGTQSLGLDNCTGDDALLPGSGIGVGLIIEGSTSGQEVCSPEGRDRVAASKIVVFDLHSYALNAFRVVGESLAEGDPGTGWAVGDHGAIVTHGESGASGGERLPDLGARTPGALSDKQPYETYRMPLTAEPGTVPALGARPAGSCGAAAPACLDAVPGPKGIGEVSAIAMSRDGSEGWGFSTIPQSSTPGVLHYREGLGWRFCYPGGLTGVSAPDSSCAALAATTVAAVSRVPLERDSDPTNDDEFEAVAVGNETGTGTTVLRYREGRWSRDEQARQAGVSGNTQGKAESVAFTAPDDGWVVLGGGTGGSYTVYHFDRDGWVACTGGGSDPQRCDDPDGRLAVALEDILPNSVGSGSAGLGESSNRRMYLTSVGGRVYAFATRRSVGAGSFALQSFPMIVYHDRGGKWRGGDPASDTTNDGVYNPTDGGYDPAEYPDSAVAQNQGRALSLAVAAQSPDGEGGFEGWAVGQFGGLDSNSKTALLRLREGRFEQWLAPDASAELLPRERTQGPRPGQQLTLPAAAGERDAFIAYGRAVLAFSQRHRRWQTLSTPWLAGVVPGWKQAAASSLGALGADGRGGFQLAVQQDGACSSCGGQSSFYRYTDRPPRPVLDAVAQPAAAALITAAAGGADASFWLGDENGALYRYDRTTGWDRGLAIPGWDSPRATRRSAVAAIAAGPNGEGVAVGPQGRIADLGPGRVGLDEATGVLCGPQPVPPCGTSRNLRAAAVAPDGSAFVAGEGRSVLWRPAGGQFRAAPAPPLPLATTFLDAALPSPERAYLLTARSQVVVGRMSDSGQWSWDLELGTADGKPDPLVLGPSGKLLALRSFAIDAEGHGYAVGDGGLLLERTGEGSWRRLNSGYDYDFETVEIPAGGGPGAIVGADRGVVLTLSGDTLEIARPVDPFDPLTSAFASYADVIGMALLPGPRRGDVEAWAVIQAPAAIFGRRAPPPQELLHYGSGGEPLLNPARGVAALPDVPAARPGEVAFAAFGKQDCQTNRNLPGAFSSLGAAAQCLAMSGSNIASEVIARRVDQELAGRAGGAGAPGFSLFTGDAADAPGGGDATLYAPLGLQNLEARTAVDSNAKHRRWLELVADPLADSGLPVFGAIGGQDLALHPEAGSHGATDLLFGGNLTAKQLTEGAGARGGLNLAWRRTMALAPAPWEPEGGNGAAAAAAGGGLSFAPLPVGPLSQRPPEGETPAVSAAVDPLGNLSPRLRAEAISTGGAATHYAVDVSRGDEKVARIVVADTSPGSLAAADPVQQPQEAGGQLRWLEEVLCIRDPDTDTGQCTREASQQAIVVSNTPTYSYGPISPAETQADAAAFEAVLLRHRANVLVSGRLGWSGRYWTLAPGVHSPCPGEPYRPDHEAPSLGEAEICGQGAESGQPELSPEAQEALGQTGQGILPVVVASTAGGRFNEGAERGGFTSAANGFWRGYSIVRLDPSGDPRKTVVEQRPILDWVGLTGTTHTIRPGRRVKLQSFAREAFGMDTTPRYYPIDTPAITHRYGLVEADPNQPWLPREADDNGVRDQASERLGEEDPCGPYLCLDPKVGRVDDQSGEVRADSGNYPRTYAIATLSVGDKVATYPLVFEPRPSYRPPLPASVRPSIVPPPANPPQPPQPNSPAVEAPVPPAIPPMTAPSALAPPTPPTPPSFASQTPLDLTISPASLDVLPPTAVTQPPTPPVNPAPPSGARREARQRQAATQKSGADSASEGVSEAGEQGGDLANAPPSSDLSAATRRAPEAQPSAWVRNLEWGGGLIGGALILALGWGLMRPTPRSRRREPEAPSPAWAAAPRNRRR